MPGLRNLLRDAITRAVAAAEIIGVRALLVHALHEQAPARPTPTSTSSPHRLTRCTCGHLLLLIEDARALLDPKW